MKMLIILLAAIITIAIIWLLYRVLYVRRNSRKKAEEKLNVFKGLLRKLTGRQEMADEDLLALAENPSTRQALFGILEGFKE